MMPGDRGLDLSLTWAAPRATPQPMEQVGDERFIVQIFGARRWSLCGRHATPGNAADCSVVTLRKGDLLYLPSRTWHFASRSPALSAHLALTAAPLVFADLLSAAGATAEMKAMSSPLLAKPLPFWSTPLLGRLEGQCVLLPWPLARRAAGVCSQESLHLALQRLLVGTTPRKPQPARRASASRDPTAAPASSEKEVKKGTKPAPRSDHRARRRRELVFIAFLGPVLLFLVVVLTYCCCPTPQGRRFGYGTLSEEETLKKRQ